MLKALVVVGALCASPALAVECQVGTSDVLRLDDWKIADDQKTVDVTYSNMTDQDISIAHGAVFFFDPLGAPIGFAAFDPDADIAAGASVSATANAVGLDRTANMKRSEINPVICLTGAVYADGTSETFSAPAGSVSDEMAKILNGK